LLLNVNILMKREMFFFPSTNVGVGPVWKEIGKGSFSSVKYGFTEVITSNK
jgi:hypothetical protein